MIVNLHSESPKMDHCSAVVVWHSHCLMSDERLLTPLRVQNHLVHLVERDCSNAVPVCDT